MSTQTRPYPGSLLSLTSKGEICIFDPTASERSGLDATEKRTQNDCVFTQSINVCARPLPIVHSLENGFSVDSSLFIQVKLDEDAARLALNLASGRYNVNNHFHRNLISIFWISIQFWISILFLYFDFFQVCSRGRYCSPLQSSSRPEQSDHERPQGRQLGRGRDAASYCYAVRLKCSPRFCSWTNNADSYRMRGRAFKSMIIIYFYSLEDLSNICPPHLAQCLKITPKSHRKICFEFWRKKSNISV